MATFHGDVLTEHNSGHCYYYPIGLVIRVGKTLTLTYDAMSRLTQINEGANSIAAYVYNSMSRPTKLTLGNGCITNYSYDPLGRLEQLQNRRPNATLLSSFTYVRTDEGYPTKITYEDGSYVEYAYDDAHQLTGETLKRVGGAVVYDHDYTYDLAGNRATKQYDGANTVTYTCDDLNALGSTSGAHGLKVDVVGTVLDLHVDRVEVTPSHDAGSVGTMVLAQVREPYYIARGVSLWVDDDIVISAIATDKSGNESDLVSKTDIELVTSAAETFTYNDAGCLIQDASHKYSYDDEHRLISVTTTGEVPIAEYTYDALGRRLTKQLYDEEGDPTDKYRYIYNGPNVIEEYEWDSVETEWDLDAQYVHGIGIDNVLTIERSGETWYYHHDGLGSVTELTNEYGELDQAYEYDAWGVPTIYDDDHASKNTYLYTGREWDSEISLYYYRARHYAPHLGRFLQPDPIGYIDGLNLYVYVTNAPTELIDPLGLCSNNDHMVPPSEPDSPGDSDGGDKSPEEDGEKVAFNNQCRCTRSTCKLVAELKDYTIQGSARLHENRIDFDTETRWEINVTLVKTGGGDEVDPSLCVVKIWYNYFQNENAQLMGQEIGAGAATLIMNSILSNNSEHWEKGTVGPQPVESPVEDLYGEAWVENANVEHISFVAGSSYSALPEVGIQVFYRTLGFENTTGLGGVDIFTHGLKVLKIQ